MPVLAAQLSRDAAEPTHWPTDSQPRSGGQTTPSAGDGLVEIGGLEPSLPHDGLLERVHDTSVQTPLPSVGAALRDIALALSQLADALDPAPPGRSRGSYRSVGVRRGS